MPFRIFQKRKKHRNEVEDQRLYEYDAFVCYNDHDSKWVLNELLPRLEGPDNQLKLWLHKQKTLLIVSNAFVSSQWCHFELIMAQTRLFRDDTNSLMLVLLENIDDVNMNPRLRLQMAHQTYVEWTNNHVGQQLFWAKLIRALTAPLISVKMN